MMDDSRVKELAQFLQVQPPRLRRYLTHCSPPADLRHLQAWQPPPLLTELHRVCDGLTLFHSDRRLGFTIWGADEYSEFHPAEYIEQHSLELGLVPIFGQCPHYTSLRHADGAVVATDWEVEGASDQGWLRLIAPDFSTYVTTAIEIVEAYGEATAGLSSDWWHPYASRGTRLDLESDS